MSSNRPEGQCGRPGSAWPSPRAAAGWGSTSRVQTQLGAACATRLQDCSSQHMAATPLAVCPQPSSWRLIAVAVVQGVSMHPVNGVLQQVVINDRLGKAGRPALREAAAAEGGQWPPSSSSTTTGRRLKVPSMRPGWALDWQHCTPPHAGAAASCCMYTTDACGCGAWWMTLRREGRGLRCLAWPVLQDCTCPDRHPLAAPNHGNQHQQMTASHAVCHTTCSTTRSCSHSAHAVPPLPREVVDTGQALVTCPRPPWRRRGGPPPEASTHAMD